MGECRGTVTVICHMSATETTKTSNFEVIWNLSLLSGRLAAPACDYTSLDIPDPSEGKGITSRMPGTEHADRHIWLKNESEVVSHEKNARSIISLFSLLPWKLPWRLALFTTVFGEIVDCLSLICTTLSIQIMHGSNIKILILFKIRIKVHHVVCKIYVALLYTYTFSFYIFYIVHKYMYLRFSTCVIVALLSP